jgi:hypothetical protein
VQPERRVAVTASGVDVNRRTGRHAWPLRLACRLGSPTVRCRRRDRQRRHRRFVRGAPVENRRTADRPRGPE